MKFLPSCLALLGLAATGNAAVVILNEYNAGGAELNGDVGKDWFEIVVVGSGIAGSTVDMRGWEFEINEVTSTTLPDTGKFQLSQTNSYWANVQVGTIITFHENNLLGGGRDSLVLGINNFATEGWGHTNIWVDDGNYINTQFNPSHDPGFPMNENKNTITIRKTPGGVVLFGPAGEGAPGIDVGVNSTEVFKLEANPSPLITANSLSYKDGSTSTFGRPNAWTTNGVPQTQDFSAFIFPVPEPTSVLLAGAAGVGLLSMRRRRR